MKMKRSGINQLKASILVNSIYAMVNYPIVLVSTILAPFSLLIVITFVSHGTLLPVAIGGALIMTMISAGTGMQGDLSHLKNGKIMALGTLQELRSSVKYPYSIKILSGDRPKKPRPGEIIKGIDGHYQIVTTEKEANEMSRKLISKKVRFSMNPLTLDDIFYYIVKKPIEEENYEDEEEWD